MTTKEMEERAKELFEMTPQPPKIKPVKKDPYKYDNTFHVMTLNRSQRSRPKKNERCHILFENVWYTGYYSECRDLFYNCNHLNRPRIRFNEVQQYQPIGDSK